MSAETPLIMIVEDDPIISLDIKLSLENLGYRTTPIVPDGETAITLARDLLPDLVLMDIGLSGEMDGVETALRLKQEYALPVVYLTAHTDRATFHRARTSAPYGFIAKPIRESDLYTTIETAIQRSRLEMKLQVKEKKYRDLVENINDIIYSLDEEGRITYISPALEKRFQYRQRDIIGRHFSEFVHPEDIVTASRDHDRSWDSYTNPIEYRLMDKDGSVYYMRSSSRPVFKNGKFAGETGVLSDITDRKAAEQELVRSEERFRLIYETADLGIFESTLEGRLVRVNNAYARMFGYDSPEEIVESVRDVAAQLYVHPEQRPIIVKEILSASGTNTYINLYRRKDGTVFTGLLKIKVVKDDEGNPLFLYGYVDVISDQE